METSEGTPRYRLFVGVDIAAVTATVAWQATGVPAIRPFTIEQSPQGFAALERRLRATGHAPAQVLVVMEATGSYWKPVWYVLEERAFELKLVNAAHVKILPGRKSDVLDAEWLAELLEHGLLRGSFVPPPAIRELRDLTLLCT